MNAIVTVIGKDKVGIIATVCTMLAENNINILDISQTILNGSFTMVMSVDVSTSKLPVAHLSTKMEQMSQETGLAIRIQRQEIFDAMHRI